MKGEGGGQKSRKLCRRLMYMPPYHNDFTCSKIFNAAVVRSGPVHSTIIIVRIRHCINVVSVARCSQESVIGLVAELGVQDSIFDKEVESIAFLCIVH